MRSDEVVTIFLQPLEKLVRYLRTDGMLTAVMFIGVATSVSKPTGQGLLRTKLQRLAIYIFCGLSISSVIGGFP